MRRDRLTTEERLSDIVETLAHGLLWLDALSVELCSHIGSCAALAHVASWPILLKKSADAVDQIFSASWKRFPKDDAEGRTAER